MCKLGLVERLFGILLEAEVEQRHRHGEALLNIRLDYLIRLILKEGFDLVFFAGLEQLVAERCYLFRRNVACYALLSTVPAMSILTGW